jgi:hypothetical protein
MYINKKLIMQWYSPKITGHSSRAIEGMNCLRLLGRWNREFESHSGHGFLVYVCFYSVFVLSCVQVAALRRADPPVKGVLPSVKKWLRNWIRAQGPEWAGRATEESMVLKIVQGL